jgi:hypothetical protein
MMLDAAMAVLIATALLISFTLAVGSLRRSEQRLSEQRSTARRLEENMLRMQAGGACEPDLVVERLPGAIAGNSWIRISTPQGVKPRQSLVGLVPADSANGGAR